MTIPTEPIGSMPRPPELVAALTQVEDLDAPELQSLDARVEGTALASRKLGA